jgi:hypothetical protein
MGAIKAVITLASGLGLVCSAALCFAPATSGEQAALGPEAGRIEIMQRRLAIGLRDLAPPSLQTALAKATGLSNDQVIAALDMIIEPPGATTDPALPSPPEVQVRSIRAGGALFVSAP